MTFVFDTVHSVTELTDFGTRYIQTIDIIYDSSKSFFVDEMTLVDLFRLFTLLFYR